MKILRKIIQDKWPLLSKKSSQKLILPNYSRVKGEKMTRIISTIKLQENLTQGSYGMIAHSIWGMPLDNSLTDAEPYFPGIGRLKFE